MIRALHRYSRTFLHLILDLRCRILARSVTVRTFNVQLSGQVRMIRRSGLITVARLIIFIMLRYRNIHSMACVALLFLVLKACARKLLVLRTVRSLLVLLFTRLTFVYARRISSVIFTVSLLMSSRAR